MLCVRSTCDVALFDSTISILIMAGPNEFRYSAKPLVLIVIEWVALDDEGPAFSRSVSLRNSSQLNSTAASVPRRVLARS